MLTPTQRKFVEAVLRGASNSEAAVAAGLSPATAGNSGPRMRKNPKVVAALAAVGFDTPGVATPTVAVPAPPATGDHAIVDELPLTNDSQEFLTALMNNPKAGVKARLEAAKALLPFQHAKIGEKGIKRTKAEAAASHAETGNKFGARQAPAKLKAVN